jgi:hypothetical protein
VDDDGDGDDESHMFVNPVLAEENNREDLD